MTASTAPAGSTPGRPVPGRGWYLVGLAIFLVGMAAMGVFLMSRITSLGADLTQIVVPGERTLGLEPGSYTIFHEPHAVVDGRIYDSPGIGGLGVTVRGADGGEVTLAPAASGARYSLAGRQGFAAFDFTVPASGDYVVAASYADGAAGPQTVIAIGAGFMGSLFMTIGGGLALAFTGAGIWLAITFTVLLKRRRAGFRF